MSEAGKPIYSRYGDEEVLAPFFATVSAILHKVMSYFVAVAEREQSNRLRRISSGAFDALFMRKGNLIYICLINNKAALPEGKEFIDEAYQKQQQNLLYGSHEKKRSNQAFSGINQHQHPSNYQISVQRQTKENSTYIRRQIEFLHL